MTISQAQLKSELATYMEIPKSQVDDFFLALGETLRDVVANAEKVSIPGLGILSCKVAEARMGRNPATGEAVKIPAKVRVSFRLAKPLKDAAPSIKKGRRLIEEQEAEAEKARKQRARNTKATGKRGPGRPPGRPKTSSTTAKKRVSRR